MEKYTTIPNLPAASKRRITVTSFTRHQTVSGLCPQHVDNFAHP
jgi:hypothetical protein